MTEREFVPWPKIGRFANEHMTVTEKIDGTNACIVITEDDIYAQSRNRLIDQSNDNAGFAAWVHVEAKYLREDLGTGRHYGEWWGQGIQRNYGLTEKRFSLFNTWKWSEAAPYFATPCLEVVPVLYSGGFSESEMHNAHQRLMAFGSEAAPGWMKPEGVVVHLAGMGSSWKITDAKAGPSKPRLATE